MTPSPSLRKSGSPADSGPAVLCFPHAGGGASSFRSWQPLLSPARVHAVQYPGREDRIGDPPAAGLARLADTVADEILAGSERYAVLFGHSMGAYVAFEVAHRLQQAGAPVPTLVVSSAAAPGQRPPVPYESTAEVLAYLESYGPVGDEIREDEELFELILGYIKDDLRMVAAYREHAGKRIAARLVAVAGQDDIPGIRSGHTGWRDHTDGDFVPVVTPGGHFYLRTAPPVALLRTELARGRTAGPTIVPVPVPGPVAGTVPEPVPAGRDF